MIGPGRTQTGPTDAVAGRRPGSPRGRGGRWPPGSVLLPRPVARLPGARRRREPARPDRPAPGGARASRVRPVLALDRPARRGPAAPPVRDVARGAGAGPRGAGRGACRWCSRRSAGSSRGRSPPWPPARSRRPGDLAKWAARRAVAPRWPSWRRDAARHWPTRSCPTREAEAGQLVRLFGADPGRIHVVPNGVEPRFADGRRPTCSAREYGAGRIRPLRRPDRAAEERAGADPGGRGRRACRWSSSATPRRATRLTRDACRRGGRRRRPLAAARSTTTTRCSPRPTRRPGSSRCRAGSRRPGLAALEAALAGAAVVVTPFGCTREYFGDRVEYARPDRPARDRPGDRRGPGATGPDPRLAAHVASRLPLVATWPGERRRSMTRSPAEPQARAGPAATATASCGGGSWSARSTRSARSRCAALAAGPARAARSSRPRRILVVQLDHLGDAVLTSPLLARLRAAYPEATIDVLASPSNREVFEADPNVDRVRLAERNWFERRPRPLGAGLGGLGAGPVAPRRAATTWGSTSGATS